MMHHLARSQWKNWGFGLCGGDYPRKTKRQIEAADFAAGLLAESPALRNARFAGFSTQELYSPLERRGPP
jgi:hypothetical protein